LREGVHFSLYATARVHAALAANPMFGVLAADRVPRHTLRIDEETEVLEGLRVEAFAVPGKIALYLEQAESAFGTREGDTIGVAVRDQASGAMAHYIPGCARVDQALAARLRGAALVLFDGTLYTDEEMIAQGLSQKTGARMGHISMAGAAGSMAAFADLDVGRRIYVHMNNSNPALREDSPEHAAVRAAGWELAHDGMEIRL
jgi:pyrroloquinoline quinone biosynthesis protein B